MAPAPPAARGFFPLDDELALLPGSLTPRLHEQLVRLGSWIPFEPAAQVLAALTGAQVTEATLRRQTEHAGAVLVAAHEEELGRLERECPQAPQGPDKQFLSVDGAFVPLLHGEWAEVRTLTIGVIDAPVQKDQEWVAQTRDHSYFSRLVDADTFGRLALVETQRRGTETAGVVAAVTDGAEWEQGFLDRHRQDAVRILDFPHAAQRLAPMAQALWGAESEAGRAWVAEQARRLKQEGPTPLLGAIEALCQAHPQAEGVLEHRNYLVKREGQMQYPQYREKGLPIGSGAMESANKLVVEARLKGAGMHWERRNVDPMLALRNAVCNDRWEEAWEQIARGLREERAERGAARQRERERVKEGTREAAAVGEAAGGREGTPGTKAATSAPAPQGEGRRGTPEERRRPTAQHPWRRARLGPSTSLPREVMLRARH